MFMSIQKKINFGLLIIEFTTRMEMEKARFDRVEDMLKGLLYQKKLPFSTVLMDSWYATNRLMLMVDRLGKKYYCPLKKNRLVDDTGGLKEYKRIENLRWSKTELKSGKEIKVKKFPKNNKVKLFRVSVSTNRTEYIATNDISQDSTNDVKKVCSIRWKVEEFHREIKQLTGIERCQCRKARQSEKSYRSCHVGLVKTKRYSIPNRLDNLFFEERIAD